MKKCVMTGKGSKIGGKRRLLRGHYNPTSQSRKKPNLQWFRVPGKPGRVLVSTKWLKAYSKGLTTIPAHVRKA